MKKIVLLLITAFLSTNPLYASLQEKITEDTKKPSLAKTLVIGCRPWDENIQGLKNMREEAHFIDFMIMGAPTSVPSNFHHLDINDQDPNQGCKLGKFAAENSGQFNTIIID